MLNVLIVEAVTDRPKPHNDDDDDEEEFRNIAISMHNDCSSTAYHQSLCLPLQYPRHLHFPPSQRVPSTSPAVFRILNKLSRSSLISLVLDWLDDRNQILSAPYLVDERDDEDAQDLYPAAHSLEELREYYNDLQSRKGGKRDVVDRIIEGDWRDGLSLYQLAMADMQYLYDHPTSQKWTALKVVQLKNGEDGHEEIRKRHRDTFSTSLSSSNIPSKSST